MSGLGILFASGRRYLKQRKSHRMLSAGGMNTRHGWRNMHAGCSTTGTWVLCRQVIRNVAKPLNQDAN